jgi:Uma2 family endonuclease
MTTAILSPPAIETLADLLNRLGNVPPERVRMQPPPGTATEADVVALGKSEKRLCELVDGVLVEKAMGFYESVVALVLGQLLRNFLDEHHLGVVSGADGTLRLALGLVRIPDVAFLSWDRFPNRRLPRDPVPNLAPDLAVEVISQGNTEEEMARKLEEYFAAGVRLVWYAYPDARTVHVYTSPTDVTVLGGDDALDGGTVLPGFRLSIREWFERAEQGADR